MDKNFVIANEFTKKWEKGYVNHPKDPGGITYNGVSLRFIKSAGIDVNGDGIPDVRVGPFGTVRPDIGTFVHGPPLYQPYYPPPYYY